MKKYLWLIFYVAIGFATNMAIAATATASGSWTSGTFNFGEESLVDSSYIYEEGCSYQKVKIGGPFAQEGNVCVYQRPNWRYGFYTEVSGPPYAPSYRRFLVVGLGSDSGMYKVTNPGFTQSYTYSFVHLPGTDDFMYSHLTMGFTNNHELLIVRNFPSRLIRSYSGLETVYTLASDSYVPLLPREDGLPIITGAVGVSPNGQWVAVEVMNVGLALIDTETYHVRLFSSYKHSYGLGSDAHITFVVSNDGRYVATFDYNIHPRVYSLSDSCVLVADQISAIRDQADNYQSCPDDGDRLRQALVDRFGSQIARSMRATGFNYDADTLYFTRVEYDESEMGRVYELPLHAGNFEPSTDLLYLALGDSYASGEGDIERVNGVSYYTPVTDYEDGCHLSIRSYPFRLAAEGSIPGDRMQSVACSGAEILPDYIGQLETYVGQGRRLKGLSPGDRESQQSTASDQFIPGKIPQLEFIKRYQPRVVTLMGGGNDVGFARILEYCATPGWEAVFADDTCGYAVDGSDLRKMLGVSIRSQYGYVKRMLAMIHEASPRTVVYVVGYPSFISGSKFDTCLNSAFLDNAERRMLNEAVSYATTVLKQAAQVSGAYFIDIEDVLEGGRMCEGSEYMTGVWQIGVKKIRDEDIQEMFHPNAKAHQKIAERIAAEGFSVYATSPTPVEDTGPPAIPVYFGGSESDGTASARRQDLTGSDELAQQSGSQVVLGPHSLQDGSSLVLSIHSSPTELGVYQAASDGSVQGSFTLPDSVKPGKHVLVLDGVSPSGEPVKYYQFITVTSGDENDIDGDGVPDDRDTCMFINEWYDEQTGANVCLPLEGSTSLIPSKDKVDTNSPTVVALSGVSNSIPHSIGAPSSAYDHVGYGSPNERSDLSGAGGPAKTNDKDSQRQIGWLWALFMTIGIFSVILLIAIKIIKGRRHGQQS